jgi:fatty acid desaturase
MRHQGLPHELVDRRPILIAMGKSEYMKSHSLRRFAFYLALAALAGAILGAIGGLANWSNGVSFAAVVVVGTTISMVALRESPKSRLHGRPDGRRRDRRPS